jgi:hypothetical protein
MLHTTSDDEMTKRNKGLHLKLYILKIYIGFKLYQRLPNYHPRGDLINQPCYNSLEFWKQLAWINIKLTKQVGIKSLN